MWLRLRCVQQQKHLEHHGQQEFHRQQRRWVQQQKARQEEELEGKGEEWRWQPPTGSCHTTPH